MRRRMRGAAAAAALVLSVCTFGLVGVGTASAAEPIVVGSCATNVVGKPGQPVSLAPAAVLGIVTDAVRAVPVLGPPLAASANQAFGALAPIPVGVLPTGSGVISGAVIADAVVAQLKKIPLLGPVLGAVVTSVRPTLTSVCEIGVKGVNAVAAPVQDGVDAAADASERAVEQVLPEGVPGAPPESPGTEKPGGNPGAGGNGGTPGGGAKGSPVPNQPAIGGLAPSGWSLYPAGLRGLAMSPLDFYGSIPFATPGLYAPSPGVRYGGAVPGYNPQFGVLGTDDPGDGVQAAGRAEALTPPAGQRIEFAVLLAVLALSVVTAALVRTWVLRKAPGAAL
ncbi:hypothetical protein [Actinophytocola xanthii]|uniref:Uncharacterized protein n=1 Tax=Actinophytocola xanthii TaxID=1912961 RepID=A0A1Q8CV86_9PSEU|nr:hypothetical protein [Actinophytocola xanthii]OLF18272.1 hypothetical protein BU204_06850 [Actinophytocola xanthii]